MSDPTKIPSNIIALGGADVTVTHLDGTTETVKVRLLPIAEYAAFYDAITDEVRLAALLCARDAAWAAGLLPSSIIDIAEKGTELNFTSALRWAERRAKVNEASLPVAEKTAGMLRQISGNSVLTAALPSAGAPPPR